MQRLEALSTSIHPPLHSVVQPAWHRLYMAFIYDELAFESVSVSLPLRSVVQPAQQEVKDTFTACVKEKPFDVLAWYTTTLNATHVLSHSIKQTTHVCTVL